MRASLHVWTCTLHCPFYSTKLHHCACPWSPPHTAAGDRELPSTTALQLVANIASLIHALAPLEEFALAQARGDTAEIVAAAAAAAEQAQRSRSPSPGRRSRSRSPGKGGLVDVDQLPEEQPRGRQSAPGEEGGEAAAAAAGAEGGSGRSKRDGSLDSRVSSHASAPSPPRSPSPRPAATAAASGSSQQTAQPPAVPTASRLSAQSGHTVHSFSASAAHGSSAAAGAAGAGGSAAAFEALLESAEVLAVQASGRRGLDFSASRVGWPPWRQRGQPGVPRQP